MKLVGANQVTAVIREYKVPLALTYSLYALEMLGTLTRPWFLGIAVDGLLAGNYDGLVKLTVVHMLWLLIGTARHMYDTRTFSVIYTAFVTRMVRRSGAARDVSRLSAHSTLARQVVDFFEFDFNYVIEAIYNVVGSLIILYLYNMKVATICLVTLVPVLLLSRRYGRITEELTLGRHDELEKQVDILSHADDTAIAAHYSALRAWQVRLSDQEAWNFGLTELLVLVVITGSLLVTAKPGHDALRVSAIIIMYNYILKFAAGLETVPYTIQRVGALKDIMRRMVPETLFS
jgi:ABC-type multidrug transport system fused ATPase/permease subunit